MEKPCSVEQGFLFHAKLLIFVKETSTLNQLHLASFKRGAILTLISGLMLVIMSIVIGKNDFFLYLNIDGGAFADFFFTYCTYLGDGIIWVPLILFFIFYKQKLLPLVISAMLISTLFVQISKNYIYPDEARPAKAIIEQSSIHIVKGVEVHTTNSFPSGHTTTVFCIFLLGCLFTPSIIFLVTGFILALLTAYSRIYLAQHFPLDAGAGMITAVISTCISLWIQQLFNNKQMPIHQS